MTAPTGEHGGGQPQAERAVADAADDATARRRAAARRLAASSIHSTALDRICEAAASLLEAESAQVSLISDVQAVVGGAGAGNTLAGLESPAAHSLCTVTVELEAPLLVREAALDERVRHLPPVTSGAVGAYLGVPLTTSEGHLVGALCVYDERPRDWRRRDVTTLERLARGVVTELELSALSNDFEAGHVAWRLAADAAGVGAFDWNLLTGQLRWDDRLLELFALDRQTFGGDIASFNRAVHPEDLPRVTAALEAAIATCGEYSAEYRVLLPGGQVRWVAAKGRALRGEEGGPVRLLGAAYDTTAEQDSEARVSRVLESMPTAFFQLDREWRFSYLNGEAERLLGSSRDDLVGRTIWEAFPASTDGAFEEHYRRSAETGEPISFDAFYPAPLDAWFEVRAWPTPDGLSVYFLDATDRHRAQDQIAAAARRDTLLADVTERLTGTLDLEEAVARLGSIVVPRLGDWCVATLVEESGSETRPPALRDVAGWHHDPDQQPLVERFADIRLGRMTQRDFLPAIIASPQPLVASGATESLCAVFEEGEVRDLVRTLAPEHAAVVTLRGRDRAVGILTVLRGPERDPFSRDDVDTLAEVAARAGLALDNARLFAEQRALAEGLQRSLLTEPPQPDHLQLVVRYEAAAETAQVGGDWYDAFIQEDGATVLVIGDVVGHDTAAAAAMGQVRNVVRAIAAYSGAGPGDLLRGVDQVLETLQVDTTATAVVARLEQTPAEVAAGVTRLRWSNAGHPPPVVLEADGAVRVLDGQSPDLLLGLDPATDRAEHEVVLERGATVLLFTDGLVERRGEDLDAGLERLCAELERLAATTPDLDELCDRLLGRMVPTRREDDIALVAVTLHPQDEWRPDEDDPPADDAGARSRTVQARFAADPASVPAIRRFVRAAVVAAAPTLAYDAELCVSELAANAALHGGGGFMDVAVRLDPTAVTLSVTDEGDIPAEAVVPRLVVTDGPAHLDREATTGRGLGIVSVLAQEWGLEVTPAGKRVWACLGADAEERDVRPPDSSPPSTLPEPGDDLPPGWCRVVLRGCPTQLSVRQDEHLDELVRELQLLAINRDNVRSRRLAAELQELLGAPAHARHLGRRTAHDAAAAGLEVVDVEMFLPHEVADLTRRLEAVVQDADRLCEEEELLTIASPPEVRQLRAWMTDEVEAQLRRRTEPVSWAEWRRRRGLPDLAH